MTVSTPVKVVALAGLALILGLGGVVLMFGKHSSSPARAATPPAAASKAHFTVKVAPKPHKAALHLLPGLPSNLYTALEKRQVAVVAIFSSQNASDRSLLAAARDGAQQAHASFVAANVALEGVANDVEAWSHNPTAPAVVVVRRPGKVVFAVTGPTDSATIAQAALTSR